MARRVEISYDKLNRPQQVRHNDATVNYGYDEKVRWTSVNSGSNNVQRLIEYQL